jgi:hypothetical protein
MVRVSGAERKPDFRARTDNGLWTYVEVTAPQRSQATKRILQCLERIGSLVQRVEGHYALEVFLRREPSDTELEHLSRAIPELCGREGMHDEELPGGLGRLRLNHTAPGQVVLNLPKGEEDTPRLGRLDRRMGPDDDRHIAVRIAYTDERADEFLRTEARQLPTEAPGLIMIRTSGAPGGWRSREALLRRRFTPDSHTRVSGICLFHSGLVGTAGREEEWRLETKLILNPHAALPLPDWIVPFVSAAACRLVVWRLVRSRAPTTRRRCGSSTPGFRTIGRVLTS